MKTSSHENLLLLHEVADSSFGDSTPFITTPRLDPFLCLRLFSLSLVATIISVFFVGSAFPFLDSYSVVFFQLLQHFKTHISIRMHLHNFNQFTVQQHSRSAIGVAGLLQKQWSTILESPPFGNNDGNPVWFEQSLIAVSYGRNANHCIIWCLIDVMT